MQLIHYPGVFSVFTVLCFGIFLGTVLYKRHIFSRYVMLPLGIWLLALFSYGLEFSYIKTKNEKILYLDTSYSMLFTNNVSLESIIAHIREKMGDVKLRSFSGLPLEEYISNQSVHPPQEGLILTDQRSVIEENENRKVLRIPSLKINELLYNVQIPRVCYFSEECTITYSSISARKPLLLLNGKEYKGGVFNLPNNRKELRFRLPALSQPASFIGRLCLFPCEKNPGDKNTYPQNIHFILRAESSLPSGAVYMHPLDLYTFSVMRKLCGLSGFRLKSLYGSADTEKSAKYDFYICISRTGAICPIGNIQKPVFSISPLTKPTMNVKSHLQIKPETDLFTADTKHAELRNLLQISQVQFEGFLSQIIESGKTLRYAGNSPPILTATDGKEYSAIKSLDMDSDYFYRLPAMGAYQWDRNILHLDLDAQERASLAIIPDVPYAKNEMEILEMTKKFYSSTLGVAKTPSHAQLPLSFFFSISDRSIVWPTFILLVLSILYFWFGNTFKKI